MPGPPGSRLADVAAGRTQGEVASFRFGFWRLLVGCYGFTYIHICIYIYTYYIHIIRDNYIIFYFFGMYPSPIIGMYSRLGIIYICMIIYVFHDLARMLVRILVRIHNVIRLLKQVLKLFSLICNVANLTVMSLTNGERLKETQTNPTPI